jgi:hypothetical protein
VHWGLCHVQDQAGRHRYAIQSELPIIADHNFCSGENKTFVGGEEYLKQKGIEVVVLQNEGCQKLMQKFIKEKPGDWNEDIGEQSR